jgi:hypothetical protein
MVVLSGRSSASAGAASGAGSLSESTLDLTVGDERSRTSTVAGSPGQDFPRIEALISISGATCFDTLIDVHAKPERSVRRRSLGPRRQESSWGTRAPHAPRPREAPYLGHKISVRELDEKRIDLRKRRP